MSQIVSSKISNRSKEIADHLNSVNLEHWFSKDRKPEKDEKYEIFFCPYCEQLLERPYWESRYNGIKGRCKSCEVVWNLS